MKLIQTIISIAKILIRSKFKLNHFNCLENEVVIVGNGPSASEFFKDFEKSQTKPTTMCVNMFAANPEFQLLKPKYYLVSDHAFLDFSEETFKDANQLPRLLKQPDFLQIQKRINHTWNELLYCKWEIQLFVPQIYANTFIVNHAKKQGLKIQFYNYTVVKGYEWFENLIYKLKLGSPQSQNVINACIFQAINANFKNIYLTGVDNNFHLNMIVDEHNHLQHIDDHFYKIEKKTTPQLHANGTPVKMHEFFLSLHKAFYAHHRLQKYASYRNVNIYNATKGSFIDAYPRKEIQFN
jgi:hypothetical protein